MDWTLGTQREKNVFQESKWFFELEMRKMVN